MAGHDEGEQHDGRPVSPRVRCRMQMTEGPRHGLRGVQEEQRAKQETGRSEENEQERERERDQGREEGEEAEREATKDPCDGKGLGQGTAAEEGRGDHGRNVEGEEGRAPTSIPTQLRVTEPKRDEHNLTHTPYRAWCQCCLCSRSWKEPSTHPKAV